MSTDLHGKRECSYTLLYLLYGIGNAGVNKPEEQVSEGSSLGAQDCSPRSARMGQRKVHRQQLHAEEQELVKLPKHSTGVTQQLNEWHAAQEQGA